MIDNGKIEYIIDNMTLDELCGQLINYDLTAPPFPKENFEKICAMTHPGSIYVNYSARSDGKPIDEYAVNRSLCETAEKYSPVPVIVTSDGGTGIVNEIPDGMAWGATDDPELIREFGREFAKALRSTGVHVFLGPVVDINYNKDNPITSTRAFSDSSEHVIKMAGAYVEGLSQNDRIIVCCKHFPGDGTDDRNQHICTTVNRKKKEEWFKTYGKVYSEMLRRGSRAVMCAHISFPSWQPEEEIDPVCGYLPGSLSKSIMTDLLKGSLGFDGCIISDAMNMIGAVAVCSREELGVRFINAGGDMMLFSHPEDYFNIKKAGKSGKISGERLRDAVRRVLAMKNRVGLLDGKGEEHTEYSGNINALIKEASRRFFRIERNADGILPLKLNRGDRILMITMLPERSDCRRKDVFAPLKQELEERGFQVDEKFTPFIHTELENVCNEYECVLINSPSNPFFSNAGTLRLGADHIGPFWDGLGLRHPKLIYTSFGNPYQLYEFPFLHTYINAFSVNSDAQKAFVAMLFGEIPAEGKNPVRLDGFFEREV